MTYATFSLGDSSTIYERFCYPAGEMQVRLTKEGLGMVQGADEVSIIARIRNASQVMELALLADAVGNGILPTGARMRIILPYLPYGRADRRFVHGDCYGLQVFGCVLNSIAASAVVTLDVHSKTSLHRIRKLQSISPMPLIERAIARFAGDDQSITVVLPDAGAAMRYRLTEALACNHRAIKIDTAVANKHRDPATGALSGFSANLTSWQRDGKVIIVDDICDGGGTFVGLAQAMGIPRGRLGLYVSHGIFSKGTEALREHFGAIYTSDSIQDFTADVVTFPCINLLLRQQNATTVPA